MFMRSIVSLLVFATALANATAIPRKEDAATQALQIKKVTDSGLLDLLDKAHINDALNDMSANALLDKIVQSDQFKTLKTQTDKKHKNKGKNIGKDSASQVQSTGLLHKFKALSGKNIQDKVSHMNAHDLVIKIAQSEAFKKMKFGQDLKKSKDKKKTGKAKVKVIIHKYPDGKPQYTVITRVGGPVITLAASGPKTTIEGKVYTIKPVVTTTATQTFIPDSGASILAPPSFTLSATSLAKLFVVFGGAFGGALLIL